jgi:hypothetical protein
MKHLFKSMESEKVKYLKNRIRKDHDLANIIHSFRQVNFAKNIHDLLVQLLGPTSN